MTERACILVVDDEEAIRVFVGEELSLAGYTVLTAASGEEALTLLENESVDLVLLDLKMGGMDGLRVMEQLQKLPIPPVAIMLTAHASVDSAVGALRRGGYDYLTKPCSTEELLGSVSRGLAQRKETLRRQEMIQMIADTARQLQPPATASGEPVVKPTSQPRFLEARGVLLDWETEIVTKDGDVLPLTAAEFRLMACLMEKADRPAGYTELANALHGPQSGDWGRQEARQAISTHIWRLRRKLGRSPDGKPYIANVRRRGYRFISRGGTDSSET